MRSDGSARDKQKRNDDLQLLSKQRKTETENGGEKGICVQDMRICI